MRRQFANDKLKRALFFTIFWVISFNVYNLMITSVFMELKIDYNDFGDITYLSVGIISTFVGVIMGLLFSVFDIFTEKLYNRKYSFGLIVLLRFVLYCFLIITILIIGTIFSFFIYNVTDKILLKKLFYRYLSIFSFSILICIILGFLLQIQLHLGAGNLFALFIGKYHKPKIEERFFMFIDMKSSTTIAEKIGAIKFSELIQDCFYDLNGIVNQYFAEIYKYVGDEVILTWKKERGISKNNCLDFYFEFIASLLRKKQYYQSKYELIPEFKASINFGEVTVLEIGNIKREIAYYGDVLNTGARIIGLCSDYNSNLLIPIDLINYFDFSKEFSKIAIGDIELRGKEKKIELYSITKK